MTAMNQEEIKGLIPHRDPFLLLDEVLEHDENKIVCQKSFSGKEFWFAGHYPDFPIMPGVLLCEAVMQAGAVLLATRLTDTAGLVPVATRANNVQFKKMVKPGDTITIEATLVEEISNAFYLKGRVLLAGKVAVRLDFACTLAQPE